MNQRQSRRQFIQSLSAVLLAGSVNPALAASYAKANSYKISGWTGDDFTVGHRWRVGDFPAFPASPERTADFVIVGGGISGLTAAHYLRDYDVLLLEQYEQAGGHARGGTYKGIDYSYAAAFVDTVEGIYGRLYSELGIEPKKLAAGDNSFYWESKFRPGISGDETDSLYKHFKRLTADTAAAIEILPTEDTPASISDGELAKLDATPFASMLSGFPPEFIALVDSICRSAVCGGSQRVSALTGLYLMEDLASSNYVFEGGNSAISKALIRSIDAAGSGRLQRGAFVWRADVNNGGTTINYTDKDGQPHTMACKHLILATPPMVAWRQLKNMDDQTKAQLMQFKYGSYLVANCLLNKQVFKGSYDNFFNSPFTIADVVVADTPYMLAGKYNQTMGSVLTVYRPWEPSTEGRPLLLEGDKSRFAKGIHGQIAQFVETLDDHLEEVALSRWGHAIAVPGPGYYARLAKLARLTESAQYSLAHSSVHGMPGTEAAIRGARYAADRALRIIK